LRILFKENLTRDGIHQDGTFGMDLEVWLCRLCENLVWERYKKNAQD
jgi:hypothetical protein